MKKHLFAMVCMAVSLWSCSNDDAPVVGLLALWLLLAGMAVAVRRFHDCNLPAWPVLLGMLLILLPIPLFFTPYGGLGGPGFFVLSMLLAACALIFILGVAIIPGGKKKNKYGLAPKGE